MIDRIIETWYINNRINLILIDALSKEGMSSTLSKRGGRDVAAQLAHIHWNRLYRMERDAKTLVGKQTHIAKDEKITKTLLKKKFKESADAYAEWMKEIYEKGGKAKGFKHGLVSMLGYFINHEAHHRGNILLTLKECGYPLPKDVRYKLYSWNSI